MPPDIQITYSPRNIAESEGLSDVHLSPDSKKLLYHVRPLYKTGEHETSAIWVADVDKSNSARQFTSGVFNDRSAHFHPDGERVIFLSDRHKAGGPAQLYSICLTGGEASPLFGKENKKGVSSFKISPDGRYVAFTSADEPTAVDEQCEKDKDDARVFGDKRTLEHLKLYSFSTGSIRTLGQPLDKHVSFLHWAHDSKSILFAVRKQAELEFASDEVVLIRTSLVPEQGSPEVIGSYSSEFSTLVQTENGSIVDIQKLNPAHISDSNSLFVHKPGDFATKESLFGHHDDALRIVDLQKDNTVAVSVAIGLETRIHLVHIGITKTNIMSSIAIDSKTVFKTDNETLDSWDVKTRADGSWVLAAIKSSSVKREPANVWVAIADGQVPQTLQTQVSSHLQWLKETPVCLTSPMFWKGKDGTDLDGIIIYPPGKDKTSGPLPTVMWMHGGPYFRKTFDFAPHVYQWGHLLASRGYLIVSPNYRGGQGHGSAFARAASNGMGTLDWDDCESMIDEVVRQKLADPNRLGLCGWSQGGFLTAWGAAVTKNKFKAGVMGAGVSDWGQLAAESDAPDFEKDLGGAAPWDSESDRQKLKGSAIWHVDGVETAVLILHGENDKRVPVSQGISYFRGLRRRSAYPERAQLVIYPREPHGFTERKHAEDVLKRVVEHFDNWL